ncbi:WG repeat-containing protein, partial [Acinetobacter baumannii]
IRSENRWYYIDHHGHRKLTMPENCAYALPFYEGLAAVAFHQEAGLTGADVVRGDRWAFIDNTGAVVIPPKFHAGNGMKPYFS